MSEFHAKDPQAIASEKLAQGRSVAARAGYKPATLRTKCAESTNEPPRPTKKPYISYDQRYFNPVRRLWTLTGM